MNHTEYLTPTINNIDTTALSGYLYGSKMVQFRCEFHSQPQPHSHSQVS